MAQHSHFSDEETEVQVTQVENRRSQELTPGPRAGLFMERVLLAVTAGEQVCGACVFPCANCSSFGEEK